MQVCWSKGKYVTSIVQDDWNKTRCQAIIFIIPRQNNSRGKSWSADQSKNLQSFSSRDWKLGNAVNMVCKIRCIHKLKNNFSFCLLLVESDTGRMRQYCEWSNIWRLVMYVAWIAESLIASSYCSNIYGSESSLHSKSTVGMDVFYIPRLFSFWSCYSFVGWMGGSILPDRWQVESIKPHHLDILAHWICIELRSCHRRWNKQYYFCHLNIIAMFSDSLMKIQGIMMFKHQGRNFKVLKVRQDIFLRTNVKGLGRSSRCTVLNQTRNLSSQNLSVSRGTGTVQFIIIGWFMENGLFIFSKILLWKLWKVESLRMRETFYLLIKENYVRLPNFIWR